MKLKTIIFLILTLVLSNCQKEDITYIELNGQCDVSYIHKNLKNPEKNTLKEFNRPSTRAYTATPIWLEGDLICVYSIDEDDKVTFIDTCGVYNIGNVRYHRGDESYANIVAEVAKECKGYFAAYPYDIFNLKVGDEISFPSDRNFGGEIDLGRSHITGNFGDASIMTSWCDWCDEDVDGYFRFKNRAALLMVENVSSNDFPITVTLDGVYSGTVSSSSENTLYFPITCSDSDDLKIKLHFRNIFTVNATPKSVIETGHMYPYNIGNIKITGLQIRCVNSMRPSQVEPIYCYAVINNDYTNLVDVSSLAKWSVNYSNRAVIETDENGAHIKKEGEGDIIVTAKYGGFTTSFTITKKK